MAGTTVGSAGFLWVFGSSGVMTTVGCSVLIGLHFNGVNATPEDIECDSGVKREARNSLEPSRSQRMFANMSRRGPAMKLARANLGLAFAPIERRFAGLWRQLGPTEAGSSIIARA